MTAENPNPIQANVTEYAVPGVETLKQGIEHIAVQYDNHGYNGVATSAEVFTVRNESHIDDRLELDDMVLQCGFDTNPPEGIDRGRSVIATSEKFGLVRSAILEAGGQVTEEDGSVGWGNIVGQLVASAEHNQSQGRVWSQLAGAVAASQFASTAERIVLMRQIYDQGIAAETAAACMDSPLLVVTSLQNHVAVVRPIADYSSAFRMPPEKLGKLLALYERPGSDLVEAQVASRKHRIQGEIAEKAMVGTIDRETTDEAMSASAASEKVGGAPTMLDLNKIERFGLQALFIKGQAEELFGTTVENIVDSNFARSLASHRTAAPDVSDSDGLSGLYKVYSVTGKLAGDIESTFIELSKPVIERFRTVDHHPDEPDLTYEQKAAFRYRDAVEFSRQSAAVLKFIDVDAYRKNEAFLTEPGEQIWTTAQDGAAVSPICQQAISQVLMAALDLEQQGVTLEPDRIYDEIQANRQRLFKLGAHNIAELSVSDPEQMVSHAQFTKGKDGDYHLRIFDGLPDKDSLDVYAAISLGCPALGEVHKSRTLLSAEERAAYGSSNYIDHALAASFIEAHKRGMFDLAHYRDLAAAA
jgi:hypothetical protein